MSLLMDALKRAEKARQAQTENQAPEKGESAPESGLSSRSADAERTQSSEAQQPPAEPQPGEGAGEPASSAPPDAATTQFALSDDFPATMKISPAESAGDQRENEKLGPFSLVRDEELSLEDTAEMLPVVREAEKSLNEYFEGADSGADGSGEVTDEIGKEDTTVVSERVDAETESRSKSAAQSVFKAKAPAMARRQRNRTLLIALPLLLLAAVGTGVVLSWDQLKRTFFGAPPVLVQRTPQRTELPPPPQAAAVSEASATTSASEAVSAARPTAGNRSTAEPAESARARSQTAAPTSDSSAESDGAGRSVARPVAKAAAAAPVTGRLQGVSAQQARAAKPTSPPATSPPAVASVGRPYAAASAGGIRISRRSDIDKVHAGISEAYLAYQRGDDAAARALYSEVARQHPNNRNALLGLGAIAVRGGNYAEAVAHYAHLLSIDSRDPIARAALINLNQRVSANEGEGHVKRLLAEDSEQPFLYFTLGNLYARQGRWHEAQQAYFDAYRRDDNSADFTFNLAVSLDRLGQTASALSYYRRALELGANGVASFEPRVAQSRIDRLSAGGPR